MAFFHKSRADENIGSSDQHICNAGMICERNIICMYVPE